MAMTSTLTMTPEQQGRAAVEKLNNLGVDCSLIQVVEAPQLLRIEVQPGPKAMMHHFTRLRRADDIAFALGASSVRICAPSPGHPCVVLEVARQDRQTVSLSDLPPAWVNESIGIPIGLDIENRPALLMLTDAPHVLVSGTTGSGKTTCLHGIICQLLSIAGPDEIQFVMVDMKRTELTQYEGIPHLAAPVADTPEEAIRQLRGAVLCMERRFETLRALGAKDINAANQILRARGHQTFARAVVVVDEIAELMMTGREAGKSLIIRLAQKGRAAGLHLILATQYPKREVITGLVRVNIPTKIAFSVPDAVASRVALGQNGAEDLLGQGDGLLSLAGLPPVRFQSAYATAQDIQTTIERVVN